jgi:hypothetical protein
VALAEALDAPVVTCDTPLAKAPGHRARIEAIEWYPFTGCAHVLHIGQYRSILDGPVSLHCPFQQLCA